MLLRRVTEHLKTQHWTAVAIDFVIVVVGVFLGIQVSNWNGARQENRRAHQALLDLRDEFTGLDTAAAGLADFYAGALGNQAILLRSIKLGRFDPAQQQALKNAVALGLVYGDPPPPSGTFRDLLSSGSLGLVRNKALRLKLIEYDQSLEIINHSDTNIQVGLSNFYPAYTRHMTLRSDGKMPNFKDSNLFVDFDFTNVDVNFDAIRRDKDFRVAAEQAYLAQQYRLINIRLGQSKIATIRKLIAKDLQARP